MNPLRSRVMFGCAPMGGHDYGTVDDATSIRAVHAAIDAGITAFDTADVYGLGHAEEVLGRALKGRREQVFIATKGGVQFDASGRTTRTLSRDWLAQALEASLTRLGTDYVDLWQLHWPVDGTDYTMLRDWLEPWRERGVIRAIGCCNFSGVAVSELARGGVVATVQHGFNLLDEHATPLLRAAHARGQDTLVHSALAQGLLSGAHRASETFSVPDLRARQGYFRSSALEAHLATVARVEAVARALDKPTTQVALRWALEQPFVHAVITGIKHPWQALENAGALTWTLPADAHAQLDRIAAEHAAVVSSHYQQHDKA